MLKKIPLFYIVLGYILGIALYQFYDKVPLSVCYISGIICIIIAAFTRILSVKHKYQLFLLPSLLVLHCFLLLGYILANNNDINKCPSHYSRLADTNSSLEAKIIEAPIPKKKSYKVIATVEKIYKNNKAYRTHGKIILYFLQQKPQVNVGDKILFKKKCIPILNNGNPGEFNYMQYCLHHRINQQAFIRPQEWLCLDSTSWNIDKSMAEIRNHILHIIEKHVTNVQSQGVAKALLIGYRNDIDNETWSDYSTTGLLHIIAISGMHIGIIYSNLLALLLFFKYFKARKTIAIIIALLFVWLFAGIIGFPPSVLRSSIMFTILALADIYNKQKVSLNLLLLCALIMLLFDTHLLFDVGFQLSFLAVLGIIVFNRVITHSVYTTHWLLQKIWQLTSTTLAAQIFTLPLCLYYFHQFPALFLVSNLVAIPLTTGIVWGEIILLIASALPSIAKPIGTLISYGIQLTNTIIHHIANFKWSVVGNIYINPFQIGLLYLFIICTSIYLWHKTKQLIIYNTIILFVFMAYSIVLRYTVLQQKKLIVYHIQQHTCLDIISCCSHKSIQSDSITESTLKYVLQPARIYMHATHCFNNEMCIQDSNSILSTAHGYKLLIIRRPIRFVEKVNIDYVVLTQNVRINLYDLKQKIKPKAIIADASNKLWKISEWEKQCADLNLPFFSTYKNGAFIANF